MKREVKVGGEVFRQIQEQTEKKPQRDKCENCKNWDTYKCPHRFDDEVTKLFLDIDIKGSYDCFEQKPITIILPLDAFKAQPLRALVACEESQRVCIALRELGVEAYSCDILDCSGGHPEWHIKDDVLKHLDDDWDLMIAHPPCTHLAVSGARHFYRKQDEQKEALRFVRDMLEAPVPHIALENPVSIISTRIRKPDQIIQPWMFGHGETKATCLWLKDLPKLVPTNIVEGRKHSVHKMPPSPERWKERSKTFKGIAEAMADQWVKHIKEEYLLPKQGDELKLVCEECEGIGEINMPFDRKNISCPVCCGVGSVSLKVLKCWEFEKNEDGLTYDKRMSKWVEEKLSYTKLFAMENRDYVLIEGELCK